MRLMPVQAERKITIPPHFQPFDERIFAQHLQRELPRMGVVIGVNGFKSRLQPCFAKDRTSVKIHGHRTDLLDFQFGISTEKQHSPLICIKTYSDFQAISAFCRELSVNPA
jgi:hypothetical protein